MKIFSLIRRPMASLFALCYLFLERPTRKEPAMSRKIQFACLFLLLGLLSTAQSALAQCPDGPLCFGNNFFVTGDYVVAGAQGLNLNFANDGTSTGTITIPDANPGITGAKSVPAGAQVVAAWLLWETVEKVGQPGTGQHGFFRPLPQCPPGVQCGPQTGYPITGAVANNNSTVSFSFGGCTGTSTGKIVQTYRADVRALLPHDKNGNIVVNGSADGITYGRYEVRLPSVGPSTPLTLGATFFIIYRVLSPDVPLNAIVIYEGTFGNNNATPNMTQILRGFYQAANGPSRLTHIVGNGKSNKLQTVYLNGNPLRSPFGSGQAAFPGFYNGATAYGWDNTTWTFPDPNNPGAGVVPGADSATTMVVPASGGGCVAWGQVIVSTTVRDDDKDGILKKWKDEQGYTDVGTGKFVSLADPDPLNQTGSGHQDVFIQLDHVVDSNGTSFAPDPLAVSMVSDAFKAHNIRLHITGLDGNPRNAIQVPTCTDNLPAQRCPYPNQPGIITWRYGWEFYKNQLVDPSGHAAPCATTPIPPNCMPRFPLAQRNSHHEVIFGDALGAANWTFYGGTLTDSTPGGTGPGVVMQGGNGNPGNMVTFYTSHGHGLCNSSDPLCPKGNDRVTITGAITNPNLNGTWFVKSVNCSNSDCSVTNTAAGPYTFQIQIGTSVSTPKSYTRFTDPNLAVASGQGGTGSGFSDRGGAGTLVTLGLWGANATLRAKAGTFMHELGHTAGLSHGGSYKDTPGSEVATFEPNCKTNYQSVMNYMFQTRLLGPNGALDFSSQQLSNLDEFNLGPITTMGPIPPAIKFPTTRWYDTTQTFAFVNGILKPVGTPATHHCDGTPLNSTDLPTFLYKGGTNSPLSQIVIPWSHSRLDVDFDGKPPSLSDPPFRGYDDWGNVDLRQVGASGSDLFGITEQQFGVPGAFFGDPGALFGDPGALFGDPGALFGDPGALFGNPGALFGDPGALFGDPGALFGDPGASRGGELDVETATAVVDPPSGLTVTEDPSPRIFHLSWTGSADPTLNYNIYRSSDNGATFSFLKSVPGTPAPPPNTPPPTVMSQDTVACNPNGYAYYVTAVVQNTTPPPATKESVPSNTVSTGQNGQALTGCYTSPVFLSPVAGSTSLQGSMVSVKWSVKDASNQNGVTFANNPGSNSLVAIGPISDDVVCVGSGNVNTPRSTIAPLGNANGINFNPGTNQFTFSWNTAQGFNGTAVPFPQGCYRLELDLDSGQPTTGNLPASAFQVQFYLADFNESVLITTTSPLPDGTVGVLYNQQLQETGGVPLLNWAVVSGSLPPGTPPAPSISLTSGTGVLSGYATTAGPYNFTAQVTDSIGDFGTKPLTLTMHIFVSDSQPPANPPFTATTALPNAIVGVPYNNTVFESGGINDGAAAFSWTIMQNSVMPGASSFLAGNPGISFLPNALNTTNGTLSGTPTTPGTYTFMVKVTDSKGNFGTQMLSLRVIGFGPTGSLGTARLVHTATLLLPSGKVLITGGESVPNSAPTTSAELYDPTTGTFSATGNMTAARSFHTATLLSNGTVLIAGGLGTGGFLSTAEIYDPATEVFTATGSMTRARSQHTATLLNDGTVLMAGGFGASDATAEFFTPAIIPANGAFSATTGNMNAVRISHTATLLGSGKVLLVGGADGSVSVGTLPTLASAELYDPIAKTFTTTTTSLTTSRENHTATQLGGSVYFIGGTSVNPNQQSTLLNSAEVYSASAPVPAFSVVSAALNSARSLHTATLLTNGSVLIAGGNGALSSAELFNPTAPSFTVTGSLASGRQFHTATLLNDGTVLVTGGQDSTFTPLASAELYFAALRPAQPTNLMANVVSGSVNLTWSASTSNNVSYNVYRGIVSGGPYTKLASVATTNFTDTTVVSGTTYYYVVTAGVDSNSVESPYSNQVTAVVP